MPMVNGIKGGGGLVENQYAMELDFKEFFFFVDSCCSEIVLDESN